MFDLINNINKQISTKLAEQFHQVTPSSLGLDDRSTSKLWANSTGVVIPKSYKANFDYYAAAQYVDDAHVHVIGGYVFYSSDDSRVSGWIDSGEIEL